MSSTKLPGPICEILTTMKRCTTRPYFDHKVEFCRKLYIKRDIDKISRWDLFRIDRDCPELIDPDFISEKGMSKITDKIESAIHSL